VEKDEAENNETKEELLYGSGIAERLDKVN
jgi:hypothetical protein